MASTKIALLFMLALYFADARVSAQTLSWSEAELAAPGAAEKLIAAVDAIDRLSEAAGFLSANAARLPAGPGKRTALERLAVLRELAGATASAADAWTSAAYADSGFRSDDSLMEAARCLIAIGENERASAAIKTVLLTGKTPGSLSRARLLSAYLSAFANEVSAAGLLRDFAADPTYSSDRPLILFILARLFDDPNARKRLLVEHPASTEALMLSDAAVRLAVSPLWFLSPGREAVRARLDAVAESPVPPTAAAKATDPKGPLSLQVGIFRLEENARALVARLGGKGFSAEASKRTIGSGSFWVVTVPPGKDVGETIMGLKDAGFESFPLF